MDEKTLFVINPNASDIVTDGIVQAVSNLGRLGVPIQCLTLEEGPPAIETQAESDLVVGPLLRKAGALEGQAAGFVVACFSDPGVHALREQSTRPVLGIQEAAVTTAMTVGQRFGIIAILPASVKRHERAMGAMGVQARFAASRALGLGVAELADPAVTLDRMIAVGRHLRDHDGADVLILGCAGMAGYRPEIEARLDVPVIDPCQAATSIMVGRIALAANETVSEPTRLQA